MMCVIIYNDSSRILNLIEMIFIWHSLVQYSLRISKHLVFKNPSLDGRVISNFVLKNWLNFLHIFPLPKMAQLNKCL